MDKKKIPVVYPYNGMQHGNKKELLIHAIPLMNLEIIMSEGR